MTAITGNGFRPYHHGLRVVTVQNRTYANFWEAASAATDCSNVDFDAILAIQRAWAGLKPCPPAAIHEKIVEFEVALAHIRAHPLRYEQSTDITSIGS